MPKVKVEGRNEIYRFPDGASREDMARQVRNHMFPRQSTASTVAKVGSTAGFLAPGTGIADVIGAYPTGEGTNYPSLVQNILQGNFADAGYQALGAVGDMAYATAPATGLVGVGIGMAAKAPRAARVARAAIPNEVMASLGDDFRIVAEATARAENQADRALLRTFEEYSTNPTLYGNMARNGHVQTVLDMFSPGFQGQQRYAKRSVSSGAGIADVPMKDLKAADEAGYLMYFPDGERGQDIVISPEGYRRLQQILERNR